MIWYMIWYDVWYEIRRYDIWYDIICYDMIYNMIYNMIYMLTAIGLTPGGSSTLHIYTKTVHRKSHWNNTQNIHNNNNI